MGSIYVSVPCLGYDTELELTINSCLSNSSKNNEINIGIAFIGNVDFYEKIKEKYKEYSNIRMVYSSVSDCFGVGKSKNLSASLYSGEDYFLQIDSHMLFAVCWDIDVIEIFEKAKNYTNNEKTIISAAAREYWYETIKDEDILVRNDGLMGYCKYGENQFWVDSIPKFGDDHPKNISEDLYEYLKKNTIAPAVKISSHFIFGNKELAKDLSLDKNIIFWEEEIIHTIDLINKGFSLVYPAIYSPVFHFPYRKCTNKHYRQEFDICFKELGISLEDHNNLMTKNYQDYVSLESNKVKIENYKNYSKIDIISGIGDFNYYPKEFINLK